MLKKLKHQRLKSSLLQSMPSNWRKSTQKLVGHDGRSQHIVFKVIFSPVKSRSGMMRGSRVETAVVPIISSAVNIRDHYIRQLRHIIGFISFTRRWSWLRFDFLGSLLLLWRRKKASWTYGYLQLEFRRIKYVFFHPGADPILTLLCPHELWWWLR